MGQLGGRRYRYWYDDGFRYWQIMFIINRTRATNPEVYYAGEIKRAADERSRKRRSK